MKAVVGMRAHSGWAALVVVGGQPPDIEILDRRRIELCDPGIQGAKQPYHFVAEMRLDEAQMHLDRCAEASERLAIDGLRNLVRQYSISRAGILRASGRALPPLAGILASHALIHTAEGEFFRTSLRRACTRLNIA